MDVDLLIVGAGPSGLYGAYYAGFRGLSVAIVDSLPEIGGQVCAMYPEKLIFDVAGFPAIKGRDLVSQLAEQAASADPTYLLDRTATQLQHDDATGGVRVALDDGTTVHAGAVIVTAGIGRFTPRELPAAADWKGGGVSFFVPSFDPYIDKDVIVVGGGDSAFDWAQHLEPVARTVTLVHRRDRFRAHKATVDAVLGSSVTVLTKANVSRLLGQNELVEVEITDLDTSEVSRVKAQAIIAALGFLADLGPLREWGLETSKRYVVVNSAMETNIARVYAAGDVTDYPGKVRLIAVGFGEVATAVNNAAVAIDPDTSLFPGHSSDEPASQDKTA
ncbi:MAG TPA: NAD(P)/FAD-dependent oxidoreductase [Nocardioidaceae bacterium]|nr:NAD(P)/FAD-dependent oxidoreductase [Nocardioidaceae bacterium]